MTPFEGLYGRPPPTLIQYIKGIVGTPLVEQHMLYRDTVLTSLKQNILKA